METLSREWDRLGKDRQRQEARESSADKDRGAGVQAADGRRGCLQVSEKDGESFTVHIPAGTQPGAQQSSEFTHRAAKREENLLLYNYWAYTCPVG